MKARLESVAVTLAEANFFVAALHRHHNPVVRDKFRVGASFAGKLVGVAQVARPVARLLDDGLTVEVVRNCTDGTPNAASFLYARCANAARELGYSSIITYILSTEPGTSLRAAGWLDEGPAGGGGEWSRPSRPRDSATHPTITKRRFRLWLKPRPITQPSSPT